MFLSHLLLPKRASNAALYSRLANDPYAQHQELWTLFGERAPGTEQPFLHRLDHTERGLEVYMLSEEAPQQGGPWVARTRDFQPQLSQGQRVAFKMRFCPVVDRAQGPGKRSVRTNAVMEAYRKEQGARPVREIAQEVAFTWLSARVQAAGAQLESVQAENYEVADIRKTGSTFRVPMLDVSGTVAVNDPAAFLERVNQGWGKSRYAGCGLMLLSRAA